jgi:hypothetical protein
VRWYWAARGETDGQRRCQTLIDRQLRAATALTRFLTTCQAAGLRRVYLPSFAAWLAPREPLVGQTDEQWAATFECRDRYLRADPSGPRLYVRQVRLRRGPGTTLRDAFAASRAATWCAQLAEHPPLAGAAACVLGELRSHLLLLALLFEPDTALLLQTRPGATLEDLQAAAHHVQLVDLSGGGGGR